MAMAAALALSPTLISSTGAASCPGHGLEQQRTRGRSGPRHSSWDCRGPSSGASAAAPFGLSSSRRDGGACCGNVAAAASSIPRSRPSGSLQGTAADLLGWRVRWGGLTTLDSSKFSATTAGRSKYFPRQRPLPIAAEKPDLTNVAGTLLRLGKQGLEAGTKLVPESVPRPVAQAGVGLAGVFVASFLLRSLFSTVTFILAIGALSYAGYFFLTKSESKSSGEGRDGSSGKPKSTDEALEEARKIMEKYK